MPSIRYHRATARDGVFYASANTTGKPQDASSSHVGMLIGIVAGSVVLALILALSVTYFLRRRRLRRAQINTNDPYLSLSRKEFTRRRKMSRVDRMHEEELERRAIICKSLASKASSRSSQAISEQMHVVDDYDGGDDDGGEATGIGHSPTNSLKDEKEWEARLQRERSNSVQEHPLLSPTTRTSIPVSVPLPPPKPTSRASVSGSRPVPHPATTLPQLPPIPTT